MYHVHVHMQSLYTIYISWYCMQWLFTPCIGFFSHTIIEEPTFQQRSPFKWLSDSRTFKQTNPSYSFVIFSWWECKQFHTSRLLYNWNKPVVELPVPKEASLTSPPALLVFIHWAKPSGCVSPVWLRSCFFICCYFSRPGGLKLFVAILVTLTHHWSDVIAVGQPKMFVF